MIAYRSLFMERNAEIKEQQLKSMKLYKINAINNDFYRLFQKSKNDLTKIIRADIQDQAKNLQLNQTGIDNVVNSILAKNNLREQEQVSINNLKLGEEVVYFIPAFDSTKTHWVAKNSKLSVNYAKIDGLKSEDYPAFVINQAGLTRGKRLKPESTVNMEITKYQTVWKDVYQPYYIDFGLKGGYGWAVGTDQKSEYSGQAWISLKGL